MNQSFHITLKSSVFDRERLLKIEAGFIEFDDTELKHTHPVKFYKNEITEWRYGVKGIRGLYLYIGRVYCIDIRNSSGEIIKLRLKSVYGMKKKALGKKYQLIWKAIQENFIRDISKKHLEIFQAKGSTDVLGIIFREGGILLTEKSDLIPWLEIGTKDYTRYYAIYSITNPHLYKAFEYLNDWNTSVLFSVSRSILKSKNLLKE